MSFIDRKNRKQQKAFVLQIYNCSVYNQLIKFSPVSLLCLQCRKCERLLPGVRKNWIMVRSYWIFLEAILSTRLTDHYRSLLLSILSHYTLQPSVILTLLEIIHLNTTSTVCMLFYCILRTPFTIFHRLKSKYGTLGHCKGPAVNC